ncbi:MAG TPA: hypothetical protein VFB62_10070 [Polyangiaceae bacterium]|nr:hypothetical protein [Polyangiaceae bacterium]
MLALVPVSDLDNVVIRVGLHIQPSRLRAVRDVARKARAIGGDLAAINVARDPETGAMVLFSGLHRLTAARLDGAETIAVRWFDDCATFAAAASDFDPYSGGGEAVPVAMLTSIQCDGSASRLESIRRAHRERAQLPPIRICKSGDRLLVHDGHHRLQIARELGHETIAVRWCTAC